MEKFTKLKQLLNVQVILAIIFFVSSWFYIFMAIRPEFYYHLHQTAFIFDKSFVVPFFCKFLGISQILTLFLTQFFYYPVLGTFIILLIGIILFIVINALIQKVSGHNKVYLISIIPYIILLAALNNYFFPFELALQLFVTAILILGQGLFNKNILTALISYLIIGFVVFYISGSGFLIVYSIAVFLIYLNSNYKKTLLFLLSIVVFNIVLPYLAYKYFIALSPSEVFFYFIPKRGFMVYDSKIFYFLCFSIPAIIGIIKLLKFDLIKRKTQWFSLKPLIFKESILFVLILISSVLLLKFTWNKQDHYKAAVDYYTSRGEWERSISLALEAPKYDFQINVNYNRSIDQVGRFAVDFFNYPQSLGYKSLFPDYNFTGENSFISMDYYYDLAYISEARHWAYESLVYFPFNRRAMQLLVKIHLINKEYDGAQKYISLLKKSIGNSEFIKKYEAYLTDTSLINNDSEILEKRKNKPFFYDLPESFKVRMMNLLEKNGYNKRAYEHLLMYYLTSRELTDFKNLMQYYTYYYNQIPSLFEEGLILYSVLNKKPIEKNFNLSTNTVERFKSFNEIYKENRDNAALTLIKLREKFGYTYFFYLRYYDQNMIQETNILLDVDKSEPPI